MLYDKKMNEIIFRYGLDEDYPAYKEKLIAEEYLKEWIQQWANDLGSDQKVLFIATDEDQIMHMRFFTYTDDRFEYIKFDDMKKGINERKTSDKLIIISFQDKEKIALWLERQDLLFESLYEKFQYMGLYFEREYYIFLEAPEIEDTLNAYKTNNSYFFEMRFLQQAVENKPNKSKYLKNIIFISLVYKDFLIFEKYLERLLDISLEDEKKKYLALQQEVINLLNEIKKTIIKKQRKDIVVLWLDQLGYENMDAMPYVSKVAEQGVFFENAFTVIPWTVPTYRYIFTDNKEMSGSMHNHEKPITKEECSICEYMVEKGYEFWVISEHFVRRGYIDRHWGWGGCIEAHAPASLILWNAICCMGENSKPVFLVAHELSHTHDPWQTTEFFDDYFENQKKRYFYARQELDHQIEYYLNFMSNSTKIIMSDHGWGEPWQHTHTVLSIISEKLKPQRVKQIFSYKYFSKLIRQLLDDSVNVLELVTERAIILCLPIYDEVIVKRELRNKRIPTELIGYCGVVTQSHIYLRYNNEREVLVDRGKLPRKIYVVPHRSDICDSKLLPWFRQFLGNMKLDISDKKFVWAKQSLLIVDKLIHAERNQLDCINKWIADSGIQRIAMRMGGEHSYTLYEWLTEDNQKKIVGFIDNNVGCLCSIFQKHVFKIEDIQKYGIEGVILSSYKHLKTIRAEKELYIK